MKAHIWTAMLALTAIAASLEAASVRTIDDFSDLTLDPVWVLDDDPAESYGPGGGFVLDGAIARFNNVSNYHYAHLETATTYDTTAGLRTDAIMRQDVGPVSTWGMGVALYFDQTNWIAITQGSAPGQYGWMRQVMLDGTLTQTMGNTVRDLHGKFLISGIELTPTEIKFHGSDISTDPPETHLGQTDIDGNVSVINEFTMSRPANFTGAAKIILGKGHSRGPESSWPNPDFDNHYGPAATDYNFSGIDYARITLPVEGLESGESGFGKEWVRSHPLTVQGDSWIPSTFDHAEYFGAGMNTLNLGSQNGVPVLNRPPQYADSPWIGYIRVNAEGREDFDDWKSLSGNIGWIVGDEVLSSGFPDLAAQIAFVRQGDLDTRRLVYTVAGPQGPERGTGAAYIQHLRDLVDAVNPDVLAYDIYPFFADGSKRSDYLENVMAVRQVGLEKDRPYFAYLQGFHDSVSESANRYNMFTHLTAGFTGYHYWTYDYRDGLDGLIDINGDPTSRYFSAVGTNDQAIKLGNSLRFLESTDVRFVSGGIGSTPTGLTNWSAGAGGDSHIQSISVVSPDHEEKDGLVGFFTDDDSQQYFMLTNLYHGTGLSADAASLSFSVTFDASVDNLLRLDRASGEPLLVPLTSHVLNLTLPGGTGDLFKYDTGGFAGLSPHWRVDADGTWSAAGSWIGDSPNAPGAAAVFGIVATAPRAVTLDAPKTVGSIRFNNLNSYSIGGSQMLTIDAASGSGNITVAAGSHSISAPMTVSDHTNVDVVNASSTLTLSGDVTATGVDITKTGAGTLAMKHVRSNGLTVSAGKVEVIAGGTSASTSRVTNVSIASGAKLDLTNNDFVVDYTGASPEFTIRDYVKAFADNPAATSGIDFTHGDGDVTIAVAEKTEWGQSVFNGITLDDTTIVGKYTYYGDSNLDGAVTSDDYVAVDVGLGTGDSWVQGDFNFSGTVTSDDYVAIDVNLGKGSPTPLAFAELKAEMIALHTEMFGAEYVEKLAYAEANGFGATMVPEPGALSVLGMAALGLLARRPRRRPMFT